jgi:predicted DsbA family dithiol-disulfide isomerase
MEKAKSELNLPLEFGTSVSLPVLTIDLQFLPYELNKNLPESGISKRKQYAEKFGSEEQGKKAEEYMMMLGET